MVPELVVETNHISFHFSASKDMSIKKLFEPKISMLNGFPVKIYYLSILPLFPRWTQASFEARTSIKMRITRFPFFHMPALKRQKQLKLELQDGAVDIF